VRSETTLRDTVVAPDINRMEQERFEIRLARVDQ
jgi:hypothetical protein